MKSYKNTLPLVMIICSFILVTSASAVSNSKKGGLSPNATSSSAGFLGPEFHICCYSEVHQKNPAAVYNRIRNEYLVVHHGENSSKRYISGARISPGLGQVSIFLVSDASSYDCCLYPDAAYSWTDDKYLVVWQQYNNSQSRWEIWGRFVPWDGTDFTIPVIKIADSVGHNLKFPKVSWNSFRNEFMVVWQEETTAGLLSKIGFKRIAANGSFPGSGYVRQVGFPANPNITYNVATDQYLAVWSEVTTAHYIDIYGARLNYQGVIQTQVFPISQQDDEQQFSSATTNSQDRFMVTWQHYDAYWGDWDIYGKFLDVNGNQVGNQVWITSSFDDETQPDVAANGLSDQYLVVYQRNTLSGESIEAKLYNGNGDQLNDFEISPGGFGDNRYPAVGTHLSGYFVTYQWQSFEPGSINDIYGRIWSPHGVFLPSIFR
ncbi:hypothetical protein ACFLUA_03075 [Chloroflexota bacterium]